MINSNFNQSNSLSKDEYLNKFNTFFLCKNWIYLSNLPQNLLNKDILYKKSYLGQYGHINSMIFVKNKHKEKSVIIQFDTVNQAALAVLSLHNFEVEDKFLEVNYFKTKFCFYYLNNNECVNNNCTYLHDKKINDYLYIKLNNNNENINSQNLALEILNVTKSNFENIYDKEIGKKYYEKQKKFPKMTIKKLKKDLFKKKNNNVKTNKNFDVNQYEKKYGINYNKNYFYNNNNVNKNYYSNNNNNNKYYKYKSFNFINKLNSIKFDNVISRNNKENNSNDSTNSSISENLNFSFSYKNHSRFNFVNNNNNNEEGINVPEYIIDIIDQNLTLLINSNENKSQKNNFDFINNNNFYINSNWSDFINFNRIN
jgi:hypothetical protein